MIKIQKLKPFFKGKKKTHQLRKYFYILNKDIIMRDIFIDNMSRNNFNRKKFKTKFLCK